MTVSAKTMRITLRPATRSDQKDITRIVRAARINPTGLAWQRFLVAVEDGRIVAVGQVKPHRDGSRELASIATVPDKQGQGLAHRIIAALIERESGGLFLLCRVPLTGFYEQFGFHRADRAELSRVSRLAQWSMRFWNGTIMERPKAAVETAQATPERRGTA